jgi:hypothetical protein
MYRAVIQSRDGEKILLIVAFTRTELREMRERRLIDVEDLGGLSRPGLWLAISAGDLRENCLQVTRLEQQLREQHGTQIETLRQVFIPARRIEELFTSPTTARRFFVERINKATKLVIFFGSGHAIKTAIRRHHLAHLYDAPRGPLAATEPRNPQDN